MAKTWVTATLDVPGFHRWPDARGDVAFLRHMHRHLFHVRVSVRTTRDDRQVEFITLQCLIHRLIVNKWGMPCDFGEMSCEMIAKRIEQLLRLYYKVSAIEVWEDMENGARVEFAQ